MVGQQNAVPSYVLIKSLSMLTDVITVLKDLCLRHNGVRTFKYQDKTYNNAQNNHKTFQTYLSDTSFHQLNITTTVFRAEFQLYVLNQPEKKDDPDDILAVQEEAYEIACNIIAAIDELEDYKGILSVYDYSILVISHYSDDDSAGVKVSLVISMPNPVSLCDIWDNFNDDPYEEPEDPEIDVPETEIPDELTITITKLPKNPC